MLREIYILRGHEVLYWRQYGTALKWEEIAPIFLSIINTIKGSESKEEKLNFMTISKFKIIYKPLLKLNLFFFMVTDLTDNDADLEAQMNVLENEFLDLFEEIIPTSKDPKIFESFHPIADNIHKDLKPKIALVGFSGVGKTTITRLVRAEEIPMTHVPTMTGDIVTVKIGKLFFNLWDFAGQESFSFLWPEFIKDSDAVLIVTDSQLKNIDESKFFIDLVNREVPNALPPEEVSRILNYPAYGMVAVDTNNRAKMITIIAEVLGISEQISPLLKPLIERDKELEAAEKSLEEGDFLAAAEHLTAVANLSFELGEDAKIGIELLDKAKMLRKQAKLMDGNVSASNTKKEEIKPEIKDEIKKINERIMEIEKEIADLELQRRQGIISNSEFNEKSSKLNEEKEELIKQIPLQNNQIT